MTPWTVARQAPLFTEFSRQDYWSGLPFPSPRDLPDPGTEPGSPALKAGSLPTEPPGKPVLGFLPTWLTPDHCAVRQVLTSFVFHIQDQ